MEKEEKDGLKLIQNALRLSENILVQDEDQLASQLWGRRPHEDSQMVSRLLNDAKDRCKRPWLRPITPSLIRAGGPLVRILEGYTEMVTSVAVTPDNKIVSGSYDGTIQVWDIEQNRQLDMFRGNYKFIDCALTSNSGTVIVSDMFHKLYFLKLEE